MYPQRLPIVDADDGEWGDILRKYLEKEHFNNDTDNAANGGHKNVTIRAGTSTAGGAPLKFATGTLLTTPEIGAMEFAGDNLYLTQTSSTIRKKVAIYDDTDGAAGDIYYRNGTGYFTRLAIGSASQILTVASGIPAWQTRGSNFTDSSFTLQDEGDATKQMQFQLSGLATATTRIITAPSSNGTMYVTGGTDVSVADGGTGRSTSTTAYGIIAAGTTATGAQQTIAPGTAGQFLKSAGASALAGFATITATDVGLGNVNNTSDANKPVSTAQQTALNGKVSITTDLGKLHGTNWSGIETTIGYDNEAYGDTIAERYTDGRLRVGAPVETGDATTKAYVDNGLSSKVAKSSTAWKIYATADYGSGVVDDVIDYSNVANAWQLAQRYDDGRLRVGTPVEAGDATTKTYVDSALTAKADVTHTHTAGIPYDLSIVAFGTYTARVANSYGDFPFGVKLQRAVSFTQVVYRVNIADASGNLVVELRKNGTTVPGSSATIAAANQVSGGTATGTWAFATGDILTVYITGIGTNPGVGLIADIRGVTT